MEGIVEILKSFISSLPISIKIIITIILVAVFICLLIFNLFKKSDSENKNSKNKIKFRATTINGDFHIGDKNDGQKK